MPSPLTPAMQQYVDLKAAHPDCLLFFRLGDFYELFFEDAVLCAKLLDITLTSKNKNSPDPIPMAGVPHHSVDKYLQQLVQMGYKIAIAEQRGPVTPGKLVEREIAQIVTPGTYIDTSTPLTNGIAAITHQGEMYQCVWGDFSTGQYTTASYHDADTMLHQLHIVAPHECVLDINLPDKDALTAPLQRLHSCRISIWDIPHDPVEFVQTFLGVQQLDGYGTALAGDKVATVALLFSYISSVQHSDVSNTTSITSHNTSTTMHLDTSTLTNLEIFRSRHEHRTDQSLYGVINHTHCAMGARLLTQRLTYPSTHLETIRHRQHDIARLVDDTPARTQITTTTKQLPDLPKITSSLLQHGISHTYLLKLRHACDLITHDDTLRTLLASYADYAGYDATRTDSTTPPTGPTGINETTNNPDLTLAYQLCDTLCAALSPDASPTDALIIADGYDDEIDTLRTLRDDSASLIRDYHTQLIALDALPTLKIKYVKNQGYLIEVSKKDAQLLDDARVADDERLDFVRRQTLKNAERYTTPYLSDLEHRALCAKDELLERQTIVLTQLIDQIRTHLEPRTALCDRLGYLDLLGSHATFCLTHQRAQPLMHDGYELSIADGRHPVVEAFLDETTPFVPNDCQMARTASMHDKKKHAPTLPGWIHIITGPNMGGKSTYLRQNALIVLLAHAGLRVPARDASIPRTTALFARIGSGDALAKNQSTFMTEMLEVANILHNADHASFVILDELGRGTSTYDGIALTHAIIDHIARSIGAKTLFATHYHELTDLASSLEGVQNYSVSVYESETDIVFLKKITRGGASKSYGIDVAKRAGVPHSTCDAARVYLAQLEQTRHQSDGAVPLFSIAPPDTTSAIYKDAYTRLTQRLSSLSINDMTPLDALQLLADIQKEIQSREV